MAFSCTSTQKSNNNVIKLNGQLVESDSAYYGSSPILLCDNFLFSHSDDVASKCIISVLPLNYWPSDGIKCDSLAKHSIYTDNCRIYGNNDNLFLYVCGEERFAFIFSIEGNNIKVKKELYSTYPDYKGMNGNYMINERSGKSLVTAANKKNIYAFLVEDKLIDKRVFRSGNVIEVYNWDGVLEKTIMLDKTGDFIKVSENNDKLYLFSNNLKTGELELWMYDIKGV